MMPSPAVRALASALAVFCLVLARTGLAAQPTVPPLSTNPNPAAAATNGSPAATPTQPPIPQSAPSGPSTVPALGGTGAALEQRAGKRNKMPPLTRQDKAAMIAYTEGYAALRSGHPKAAIQHLKQAIQNKPNEAQFHYLLAQAYGKIGNYPMRWYALRQAVRLNPQLKGAVHGFEQMWRVAVEKGSLDVGIPEKRVKAELGKPDQTSRKGSVWVYGYRAIEFLHHKIYGLIDLRGSGRPSPATEVFRFNLGPGHWRLTQRRLGSDQSTLVYQPKAAKGPRAQVTLTRLVDMKAKNDPHQLMTNMKQELKQRFPDLGWRVLHDSPQDVLFEWWLTGSDEPHQHQIVRMASGSHDVYQLSYASQADPLKSTTRARWVSQLKHARLEPVKTGQQ